MVVTDPHEILLYPYVTEKSLNLMSGTSGQDFKDGNRLEFIVHPDATKPMIKKAFEALFQVDVEKVNTYVRKDGKHAIIKLTAAHNAEEVGMRIGVF